MLNMNTGLSDPFPVFRNSVCLHEMDGIIKSYEWTLSLRGNFSLFSPRS
jgi:hypothetical protein